MDTPVTETPETQDPSVVGRMEEAESNAVNNLRRQANAVISEIGQLEVRKARMLGTLGAIEAEAQKVMNAVAQRLGIPEGQPWQASPDGSVRVVPQGGPQGVEPPA